MRSLVLACAALGACAAKPSTSVSPPPPAPPLVEEAGFLDVAEGAVTARLFYSFHPAADTPESKPLALLFNGGPGASTALLLALNTGPRTINPALDGGGEVGPNPASWTSFANLLYVDAREVGFSYDLVPGGGGDPTPDELSDAVEFVRALLAFLSAHPALRASPVVLVGESYGGVRATRMLDDLLHYRAQDPALAAAIQAHLDSTIPDLDGREATPGEIARQFGRQVLIQPFVLGENAQPFQQPSAAGADDSMAEIALVAARCEEPAVLRALWGVDPASIAGLAPAARGDAWRPWDKPDDEPLARAWGALGDHDYYFDVVVPAFVSFDRTSALGDRFLANVALVDTFITDAGRDEIFAPDSVAIGLGAFAATARVSIDAPAPGWLTLDYADAAVGQRRIRYPRYPESGHMVSADAPRALHDDVAAWLAAGEAR